MKANLALATLAVLACNSAFAQKPPSMEQITNDVLNAFIGAAKFQFQKDQQPDGERPLQMRRPVFTKAHGCAVGRFDVNPAIARDAALIQGVFNLRDREMPRAFQAWVRFSNDGAPGADAVFNGEPGRNPNRGMAVKLVGVPHAKILDGETTALTQDFIMQNHPVFFVQDALGFNDLITDRNFRQNHKDSDQIMTTMEKQVVANPLLTPYWTPTPYSYGPGRSYKYFVVPTPCAGAPPVRTDNPMTSEHFLRENLAKHLRAGPACFKFFGQFFVNEQVTPTDKAMIEWRDPTAPLSPEDRAVDPRLHTGRHLGTLTIHAQDINRPGRKERCESLSFNPWHSLPEHTPVGSLNLLRKMVYQGSAKFRRVESNKLDSRLVAEPTRILPTE